MSPQERTTLQAITELNSQQRKEDIREAVAEAITDVLRGLMKK